MKKINNKGFTLVELLATIVILALISGVTVVSVTKAYDASKEKASEAFVKRVENFVEEYISLNSSKMIFDKANSLTKQKCHNDSDGNRVCDSVSLFPTSNAIGIETIANSAGEEFINPSSNNKCVNTNTGLAIYRDNDFVYCFIVEKKDDTSCLVETIDTCNGIFEEIDPN